MNCLPSAVGFTKSLVTKPKSSSMVTQRLTSRNSSSPVFSADQACRNISSMPLFSKAEVSACRMRSFDRLSTVHESARMLAIWANKPQGTCMERDSVRYKVPWPLTKHYLIGQRELANWMKYPEMPNDFSVEVFTVLYAR